jgi:protein-S-isoprenylcysteine O-methyltransferase Ste14
MARANRKAEREKSNEHPGHRAFACHYGGASPLAVKRALGSGCLVTGGVYRLCRNPMYAGFVLFIVPGLALLLNNLLLIVVSAVMFMAFKLRISREEDSLTVAFGQEYENYRSEVRQLVPLPRRRA